MLLSLTDSENENVKLAFEFIGSFIIIFIVKTESLVKVFFC